MRKYRPHIPKDLATDPGLPEHPSLFDAPIPLDPLENIQLMNTQNTTTKEPDVSTHVIDNSPLTFGKYKGQTPNQVYRHDPGWLVWAAENVKNREVCSEYIAKEAAVKLREIKSAMR